MDIAQLKAIQQNFLQELQDAKEGKKTSLPFIMHRIPSVSLIENGESFQVMVIGGSVFKKALLQKKKDTIGIIKKEIDQPLSFKTEKDFLKFVDQEVYNGVHVLALNFAYPIKPVFENGRLDGVLFAVTKEGSFHGLVGKKIGAEIERYIFKKRKKKITVSVANDTICLLLSGLIKYEENQLAAGIVGTGLNFAFFLDKDRVVNLESANFDKFPQSKEGKIIDQQSFKPTTALFEKETAGAYLYKHFNIIIKEKKIDYPLINSTEELNRIARHPEFISGSSLSEKMLKQVQHDRVEVSEIAQSLLKRSAQLVGCQIAGITQFKKQNAVFNMEGSLFWKGNGYRETAMQTVKDLVPDYNVRFLEIENSAILGAANLVA